MLGFPVIRDDIHREREKLKIPDHPEASQLIERLVAFPPKTVEAQGKIFEYLSTQIDRMHPPSLLRLSASWLISLH